MNRISGKNTGKGGEKMTSTKSAELGGSPERETHPYRL